MQLKINLKYSLDKSLNYVLDKLPFYLKDEILCFLTDRKIFVVNEIKIRASSFISFFIKETEIKSNIYVVSTIMEEIIACLCAGSIYAHFETIKKGYISVGKGIRAGICGSAVQDNSEIIGICNISSINIRIPQRIFFAGEFVFNLLKENAFNSSVLLYSAPGVGKTTILRDLVCRLTSHTPSIRHAVIDTREEITPFLDGITSDVFLSYPKGMGIEQATKNMTPQIIICDEITNREDAEAILYSACCGVTLVATTHAKSYEELMSKEIIKPLFDCGCFDYAVGVKRNLYNKYEYTINCFNENSR